MFHSQADEVVVGRRPRRLLLPPTAPLWSYTFRTGSCGPPTAKPWWEQLWEGLTATVTGWITSAVVLALNAFAKLVDVLAQFGAWLWNSIQGAAQAVASAVQAAATVVVQVVNWVLSWIGSMLHSLVDPVLKPLYDGLLSWALGVQASFSRIMAVGDDSTDAQMLFNSIFVPWIVFLVKALSIAVEVVIAAVIIAEFIIPGAAEIGAVIKEVLSSALKKAAENWFALAITLDAGIVLHAFIPVADSFWDTTTAIGSLLASIVIVVIQEAYEFWDIGKFMPLLTGDYVGLALSLTGFFVSLATVLFKDTLKPFEHLLRVMGAVIAGIGLMVTLGTDSWNDDLPFAIGFLDEGLAAGSFGYALAELVVP